MTTDFLMPLPVTPEDAPNPWVKEEAASWAAGWNACLEALKYFNKLVDDDADPE